MKSILLLVAVVALIIPAYTITPAEVSAQVPKHCGYSQEHACALPDEDEAEKLLEVFPDAIVIVDEELYESIPEDVREDAEGIIDNGPLEQSSDQQQQAPPGSPENNFAPLPPGSENLPPAEQSAEPLIQKCMQSPDMTREKCEEILLSSNPGNFCTILQLAGVPCPKFQDPALTFGDPNAAGQQSQNQIQNTQNAIDQCIAAGVCKP